MSDCCTVMQGREGQTGSWCVDCGTKVLEVHDRPCNECKHFDDKDRFYPPICKHHHMLITRTMHVCYHINPVPPSQHGLCFESKETTSASN